MAGAGAAATTKCVLQHNKLGFFDDDAGATPATDGGSVRGLRTPVESDEAANKQYVDDKLAGIDPKAAAEFVTYVTAFPSAGSALTFTDAGSAVIAITTDALRVLFVNIGGVCEATVDGDVASSTSVTIAATPTSEIRIGMLLQGTTTTKVVAVSGLTVTLDTAADLTDGQTLVFQLTDEMRASSTSSNASNGVWEVRKKADENVLEYRRASDWGGLTSYTTTPASQPIVTSISQGSYLAIADGFGPSKLGRALAFVLADEATVASPAQELLLFRSSNFGWSDGVDGTTIAVDSMRNTLQLQSGDAQYLAATMTGGAGYTYTTTPSTTTLGVQPAHMSTSFVEYLNQKIGARILQNDVVEQGASAGQLMSDPLNGKFGAVSTTGKITLGEGGTDDTAKVFASDKGDAFLHATRGGTLQAHALKFHTGSQYKSVKDYVDEKFTGSDGVTFGGTVKFGDEDTQIKTTANGGTLKLAGALTTSSIVAAAANTSASLYSTTTTGNLTLGNAQTTGNVTIGAAHTTGNVTLGGSSAQVSIQGATTASDAKTTFVGGAEFTGGISNGSDALAVTSALDAKKLVKLGESVSTTTDAVLEMHAATGATPVLQIFKSGVINCVELNAQSDERVKTDIRPHAGAKCLDDLASLECLLYDIRGSPSRGVSAQRVQASMSELVSENSGLLSVNYAGLTASCIGAINELRAQVEALQAAS